MSAAAPRSLRGGWGGASDSSFLRPRGDVGGGVSDNVVVFGVSWHCPHDRHRLQVTMLLACSSFSLPASHVLHQRNCAGGAAGSPRVFLGTVQRFSLQ
jgi:hypothetical protein